MINCTSHSSTNVPQSCLAGRGCISFLPRLFVSFAAMAKERKRVTIYKNCHEIKYTACKYPVENSYTLPVTFFAKKKEPKKPPEKDYIPFSGRCYYFTLVLLWLRHRIATLRFSQYKLFYTV